MKMKRSKDAKVVAEAVCPAPSSRGTSLGICFVRLTMGLIILDCLTFTISKDLLNRSKALIQTNSMPTTFRVNGPQTIGISDSKRHPGQLPRLPLSTLTQQSVANSNHPVPIISDIMCRVDEHAWYISPLYSGRGSTPDRDTACTTPQGNTWTCSPCPGVF